mgnify:CR=1 FL=1
MINFTVMKFFNFNISKKYLQIEVNFDSQLVEQLFHPALAHLEVTDKEHFIDTRFDIYLENNDLCLFKDKELIRAAYKKDYHLIQGKFLSGLFGLLKRQS